MKISRQTNKQINRQTNKIDKQIKPTTEFETCSRYLIHFINIEADKRAFSAAVVASSPKTVSEISYI